MRRHFGAVYRFFGSKGTGNVDDLTQRTFAACLAAAARYRSQGSFRAYLLTIARVQLLDHLRKTCRRGKVFDAAVVSMRELADPDAVAASVALLGAEAEHLLLAALRAIPLDFQLTLELFYWEELSVAEVGQVLGVEPGTVKSRLHRARTMLRAQLDAVGRSPELAQRTYDDFERWARSIRDKLS